MFLKKSIIIGLFVLVATVSYMRRDQLLLGMTVIYIVELSRLPATEKTSTKFSI